MDASLDWCRQRMLGRGSPLAASLHFAPERWQDAIVALRAVISEIAAVPDTVSDVDIARKKLAWWHDALRDRAAHPAIEALVASGAAERLAPERFDPLITSVASVLESPRFERLEETWRHCTALGGPAVLLEAELVAPGDPGRANWSALGGFAYLVRLVRDLGVDARANRWLVPLDLQAEYQVSRKDALDGSAGRGWDGMIRALLEEGSRRAAAAASDIPADVGWRQRHLMVSHQLDRRLSRTLARHPRHILAHRVQAGHVAQVWLAWRTAVRLRRAA